MGGKRRSAEAPDLDLPGLMGALAWIGMGLAAVCAACLLGVVSVALRGSWKGDPDGERDRFVALILGIGLLGLVGAAGYGVYSAVADGGASDGEVEALQGKVQPLQAKVSSLRAERGRLRVAAAAQATQKEREPDPSPEPQVPSDMQRYINPGDRAAARTA